MLGWLLATSLLGAGHMEASPVQLEANVRAGYALVQAKGPTLKQVQWLVIADGEVTGPIHFDDLGHFVLVVTVPEKGTVSVYAVGLLENGTLVDPVSIEIKRQVQNAADPGAVRGGLTSGPLRITLVVNVPPLPLERELLESERLKGKLAGRGHRFLWAQFGRDGFQAAWEKADDTTGHKLPHKPPFLFVQDEHERFVATYPLQLAPTLRANEDAILALFPEK